MLSQMRSGKIWDLMTDENGKLTPEEAEALGLIPPLPMDDAERDARVDPEKLQALLEALPETTPRGFRYVTIPYQNYSGESMRELTVQESSLATEHRLWIGPADGDRMHLTEDVVRQLRDALTAWLEA